MGTSIEYIYVEYISRIQGKNILEYSCFHAVMVVDHNRYHGIEVEFLF